MALHRAENEAIRLLDEFVCQAVPHPCVVVSQNTGPVAGRGENEGMRISEETISGLRAATSTASASSRAESGVGEQQTSDPGKRIVSLTLPELRSLSTAELLQLIGMLHNKLERSDLELIREVTEERLARCREEITLADQLLATCQQRVTNPGSGA